MFLNPQMTDGNNNTQNMRVVGAKYLAAITLMIAESNPAEKDIMVKLVMNLLDM